MGSRPTAALGHVRLPGIAKIPVRAGFLGAAQQGYYQVSLLGGFSFLLDGEREGTVWQSLIALAAIFGIPGGFLGWLVWHTRRQAKLQAEHAAEFREHIQGSIAANPESVLDVAAIAQEWGFDPEQAPFEAANLYRETVRAALDDGVVTQAEQRTLDAIAFALQIDDETREWLHDAEKQARDQEIHDTEERAFNIEALHARQAEEEVEREARRVASEVCRKEKAERRVVQEAEEAEQRAAEEVQRQAELEAARTLAAERNAALNAVWPIGPDRIPAWSLFDIWQLEVVGESDFQRELLQFAGGKKTGEAANKLVQADLTAEPTNRHDHNCVVIAIRGKRVGYLAAEDALRWKRAQREERIPEGTVRLPALITGGWKNRQSEGHFGVRLDFSFARNETAVKRALGKTKRETTPRTVPSN